MKKLILIGILFTVLVAQETLWEPNGVPVRQGVHIEWQRTVCPGDNGSAIFVWSDTRYGARNVFAQKIDSNGNFLWGNEGIAVTHLPGRQEDPVAIGDGSGGAFIAWVDYRFDDEGDIFIQHVDGNGNRLMVDEGEALARVDGRHLTINMCTDSSGGVFVTWQDKRNLLDDDIYGTHVSANHNIVSPGNGVSIIEMNGNQGAKSLEYAGSGQALLVWSDTRSGSGNDIYGQKLTMDMSRVFADDGLPISVTLELETTPRTTYMSHDTSFVLWQSGTELSDIFFNFLTSDGLVFDQPKVISTFSSNKKGPRIKRNAIGDVFIQWTDYRADTTNGELYYQKISPGGVLAWNESGVQLDDSGGDHDGRFADDGAGGIHVIWERGLFPNVDVMYQHITSDGVVAQNLSIPVSQSSGYQSMPIAVSDGSSGAYLIFIDQEMGSIDMRVQYMLNDMIQFEDNGRLAMAGLDGDVNYVTSFYTDGLSGESILTWVDSRNQKKMYGNHILPDGPDSTSRNGVELSDVEILIEELENEPVSIYDNNHIYNAVYDASTGSKLIRINQYDIEFNTVWEDSGRYVYESPAEQRRVHLVMFNNHLTVLWSEIRDEFEYDIFYQQFDDNGLPLLEEGGVRIVDGSWVDNYVEGVMVTQQGELLVIWVEDVWGSGSLKYNFINPDGTLGPHGISGGYLLDNTGDPDRLVLTDWNNGSEAVVAWEELHQFAKDIYVNTIDQNGILTSTSGIALTSADNDQSNIKMVKGDNDILVVWEDFENGVDFNITGQRIDHSLNLIGDNIPICHKDLFQGMPTLTYDGENRFIVSWEDERGMDNGDPVISGGMDIYLQVISDGNILYEAGGIPVAVEYHNQSLPQLDHLYYHDASDPVWLLYWLDMRSSGKADLKNLYAQGIEFIRSAVDDQSVPHSFKVSPAYPNPFNHTVFLDIHLTESVPIIFSVTNLLGQVVYQKTFLPEGAGSYQISWNGKDIFQNELPSGIYFYYVKTNQNIYNGKFTYLK